MKMQIWAGVFLALFLFSSSSFAVDSTTEGRWIFNYDTQVYFWDTTQPIVNSDLNALAMGACLNQKPYKEWASATFPFSDPGCSEGSTFQLDSQSASNGIISCNYTEKVKTYPEGTTDSNCFSQIPIVTLTRQVTDTVNYQLLCEPDLIHTLTETAGVISDIQLPKLKQSLCISSCNYNLIPDQTLVTYVPPQISDQYGCTYNYNGYMYDCSYDAPVSFDIKYTSDGVQCTEDGIDTDYPINTNETNLDLTPLVEKQTETNNLLNTLLDNVGVPDATDQIDNNADLLNVHNKINSISDGSYKPFGSGFTSNLFPSLPQSTGLCLKLPVIKISGHNFDVNTPEFCELQDILRSTIDFILFFLTWFYIFNLWRNAIKEVA